MSMVGEQTARKHGIANDYSKEPSFLSTYFMLHMRQKFVRAASSSQGPPRKALKLPMNDPVRPADLESAVRVLQAGVGGSGIRGAQKVQGNLVGKGASACTQARWRNPS